MLLAGTASGTASGTCPARTICVRRTGCAVCIVVLGARDLKWATRAEQLVRGMPVRRAIPPGGIRRPNGL